MDTLGSMKAGLTRYIKDDENTDLLTDVINDAIESLWDSILLVSLGQFLGGPVQVKFASGSERATIVSIVDPITPPVAAGIVGGNFPQRTEQIAYTLVTESGSETRISPILSQFIPLNQIVQVTPPAFVNGAIGWNCYAGSETGRLALQNDMPLDFSQSFVESADDGIIDNPDQPSAPQVNNTADNIFYLRLLQVQNPDSTYTTWQAGDVDGLLFQRACRNIAPASTFQSYAYDFVNGNTIEIRPAAGQELNPRYFFVVKPRRLRFDRAILPFTNISATEFIRTHAAQALCLSNHEYTAAHENGVKAEAKRQSILLGLNTQATHKQQTVVPYFRW